MRRMPFQPIREQSGAVVLGLSQFLASRFQAWSRYPFVSRAGAVALTVWSRIRTLPGVRHALLVAVAWNHEFRDARLILERDGDLQYFQLTGRVQRVLTRSGLSVAAGVCLTLLGLFANNVRVVLRTAQLETVQAQTMKAVAELDEAAGSRVAEPGDVRQVAARVRSRQSALRHLLDTSVAALSAENAQLWGGLQRSGISGQRFDGIRSGLPAGGPPEAPAVSADDSTSREVIDEVIRNKELKQVLRALPAQMPLFDAAVTSDFGLRHHPILGKVDEHRGVDLYSRTNRDAVLAVAPGVVKEAGYSGGYGNMVLVEHNGGIETLYGHMASVLVHPGQSVAAGAQLGQVGNTGLSTGKHLHFEVLVENVPLDPEKVISAARNLQ
jgi:murein DD-endopeptidase MepM/ murein hydrolase activator NlpD